MNNNIIDNFNDIKLNFYQYKQLEILKLKLENNNIENIDCQKVLKFDSSISNLRNLEITLKNNKIQEIKNFFTYFQHKLYNVEFLKINLSNN